MSWLAETGHRSITTANCYPGPAQETRSRHPGKSQAANFARAITMPLNREPSAAELAARFKPGQPSANPGGRPKGLERRIREQLRDDWEAITLALRDIALGRLPPGITGETTVKIRDRIDAIRLLYDRGWGKARTVVDVNADIADALMSSMDVSSLDEESLEELEAAIARAHMGRGIIDVRPGRETRLAPTVDPIAPIAPEPADLVSTAVDPESTTG
jgi:hypothetical protein